MNRTSRRALVLGLLALLLLLGAAYFLLSYFVNGGDWATFQGSPHVYSEGSLNTGRILDAGGNVLIETVDGKRQYNEDATVRVAMLHAVGDRYGNIATDIQSNYLDRLVGYDFLNGVYSLSGQGNDIVLTLSSEVCAEAYSALNGRKGTVGVYNYKTGELICMVSSPSFDPDNVPDIAGDTTGVYEGVYLNRLLSSNYVPGSIFKLVTASAAIDCIDDIFEQSFYCGGSTVIGGDVVNCSGVHGHVDFRGALAVSCNVAFAEIALQLNESELTEYAVRAGLNTSIEFDRLTTSAGHFDISGAASSDIAWSGIGQYTDMINPLSFMVFVGAIANEGQVVYPHIIEKITGLGFGGGKTEKGETVLSRDTANTLADMMSNNVSSVYGEWNFPGLDLCAKSGTAEIGGEYAPHSLFTGFIRNEDYPLAFIVIVENGGSGSDVAGPIANRVLQKCVAILGGDAE